MDRVGRKKLVRAAIAVTALAVSIGLAGCGQATGSAQGGNAAAGGSSSDQRQNQRMIIYGKVKSIVGNEVEVQLAKRPKRPAGMEGGTHKKRSSGSLSGAMSGSSGKSGMPMGGGGFPGGGSASSMEMTGKVETITIPVGVPIEQRSGQDVKQLDIGDIYAGCVIQVWADAKDKSMITRVSVTAQTSSDSSQ